jgi:hypothetical protein
MCKHCIYVPIVSPQAFLVEIDTRKGMVKVSYEGDWKQSGWVPVADCRQRNNNLQNFSPKPGDLVEVLHEGERMGKREKQIKNIFWIWSLSDTITPTRQNSRVASLHCHVCKQVKEKCAPNEPCGWWQASVVYIQEKVIIICASIIWHACMPSAIPCRMLLNLFLTLLVIW